ncbi:hypothetical protein CEXT_467881 [Caerostris extrusa]|uniref:Uncharacterized protein n=1 Tax=Caerostris extrusa TaxID=172846 RepID=A0AAV4UZL1_CAEEX|nr:hypothetical protein CEXT_467881 [Caerostris extrusa]
MSKQLVPPFARFHFKYNCVVKFVNTLLQTIDRYRVISFLLYGTSSDLLPDSHNSCNTFWPIQRDLPLRELCRVSQTQYEGNGMSRSYNK